MYAGALPPIGAVGLLAIRKRPAIELRGVLDPIVRMSHLRRGSTFATAVSLVAMLCNRSTVTASYGLNECNLKVYDTNANACMACCEWCHGFA